MIIFQNVGDIPMKSMSSKSARETMSVTKTPRKTVKFCEYVFEICVNNAVDISLNARVWSWAHVYDLVDFKTNGETILTG